MVVSLPPRGSEPALLLENWLEKESRWLRKWHWRYVTLTVEGRLRTYTSEPAGMVSANAGTSFSSAGMEQGACTLTDDVDVRGGTFWSTTLRGGGRSSFRFSVTAGSRSFCFAAETCEMRDKWARTLEEVGASLREERRGPRADPEGARSSSALPPTVPPASPSSSSRAPELPASPSASTSAPAEAAATLGADSPPRSPEPSPRLSGTPSPASGAASSASGSPPGKGKGKGQPPGKAPGKAPPCKAKPPALSLPVSEAVLAPATPSSGPPGAPKASTPGKAPPGKRPPPPKLAGAKQVAGAPLAKAQASKAAPKALPIGRRLTLRMTRIDAQAFSGLTHPPTPALGSQAKEQDREQQSVPAVDPAAIDLDALRTAFAPQARPPPKKRLSTSSRVELLPRDAAQNIGIVLAKLRVDTRKLATALEQLDPSVCLISSDEANRLLDVWPAAETLQALTDYSTKGADISRLRDVERQIMPLVLLSRMGPRLRLMVLAGTLEERVGEGLAQLERLQVACKELQASTILRDLIAIIAVTYNYVNFGTQAADSRDVLRGFDVQSLLRLRETKAYRGDFSGFHMLHFVLKQLLQQLPELRPSKLNEEFSGLPKATGVTLERLRQDLALLRGDHAFVQAELRDHRKVYETPVPQVEEPAAEEPPSPSQLSSSPPPSPPPPDPGPRVFNIADDDAASEPERDATPRPPVNRRQNVLEVLMGNGRNLASLAEAWVRGDEVLGGPLPTSQDPFFDVALAADGEPPPPGWLWLWKPSRQWQRCWCEVRRSFLVIYNTKEERFVSAVYVVLPNAEIIPFGTAGSSDVGLQLAESTPYGFEIKSRGHHRTIRLCASRRPEVERWLRVLSDQVLFHGTGIVFVHEPGRPLQGGGWRQLLCFVRGGRLLGFVQPRHAIEGRDPDRAWTLTEITVRSLQDLGSSHAAQSLAVTAPHGFEIFHPRSGRSWQFVCDSQAEESAWLRELVSVPRTPREGLRRLTPATLLESVLESPCFQRSTSTSALAQVEPTTPAAAAVSSEASSPSSPPIVEGRPQEREQTLDELRRQLVMAMPPPPLPSRDRSMSQEEKQQQAGLQALAPPAEDSFSTSDPVPPPPSLSGSTWPSFHTTPPTSFEVREEQRDSAASHAAPEVRGPASAAVCQQKTEEATTEVSESQQPASDLMNDSTAESEEQQCGDGLSTTPAGVAQVLSPSSLQGSAQESLQNSVQEQDSESATDSESEPGSPKQVDKLMEGDDCIGRLTKLDLRLAEKTEEMSKALTVAEDDCRSLLEFFGLEAPSGPRLSALVLQLLESLSDFVKQLRTAWEDLERHNRRSQREARDSHAGAGQLSSCAGSKASTPPQSIHGSQPGSTLSTPRGRRKLL